MEDDGSNEEELNRKLRIASRLFAYSEGKMKIIDAMKVAGYKTPERKANTVFQRVRRAGVALQKDLNEPPPAMVLIGKCQHDSSISSSSISNIVINSSSSQATRRSIAPQIIEKQKRRRPKDKQYEDAARIRRRKIEVNAIKVATKQIQYSRNLPTGHPEKKSDIAIVKSINEIQSSNISVKTASMMVQQGRIGISPVHKGPEGILSTQIWGVLKGAFISYINLE